MDDPQNQVVSARTLGEALGQAKGEVMVEIDAKIGIVLSLLAKAGIIDHKMVVETIRDHIAAHDNDYIRGRLKDMLDIWEDGGPTFTVIDGGKTD